jgi:hypothetical protein
MKPLIVSIVFVLASSASASAQAMSTTEYQAFLKILDSKLPEWNRSVSYMDVRKLSVPYRQGKVVADAQTMVLKNLEIIHKCVDRETNGHRRLSNEFTLYQSLEDVASGVETMIDNLPDSAEAGRWSGSEGLPLFRDIMLSYVKPLRDNIDAYADELQDRAERCSR